MSVPAKQIDGDVLVGRNITAGGDATVRGSATVDHDVTVKGWLYAPNIKSEIITNITTDITKIYGLLKGLDSALDEAALAQYLIQNKYVTQSWVNDILKGYLTKQIADDLYQPKGDYPTYDLSIYLTKDEAATTYLEKSVFDELLEKVNIGTDANPKWAIRAKYGLYTNDFLAGKGKAVGSGDGSTGGGSLFGLMREWPAADPGSATDDALGANLGWELRNKITTLEGANFATQDWVLGKNYLTGITKSMIVSVLTGDITSHTHSQYLTSSSLHTLTVKRNGTTVGTYKPDADATINISDVASAATLSAHIGSAVSHITPDERAKWNKVVSDFAAITGSDSDTIINKWEEVVAFLDTYTEADTLANLLGNKADKTTTDALAATLATKLDTTTFTDFKALFDSMFERESDGKGGYVIHAKYGLYTDGFLAGKGISGAPSGSTGGGSLFGLYTDTTWVSTPAESDALSAVLGKSLHARVSVLEGAGYLTGITKAMVENVLTGDITSHTHSQYLTQHQSLADYYTKSQADTRYARQAAPNNFMHSGNEMTFVPSGYSFPIWINYQTVGGTNGAITEYRFGNGSGGAYADVRAKRFIVSGGTAAQFLMADGSLTTKVTANNITNTGWQNNAVDDLKVPTMSFLAYWNGAHTNGGTSNLKYCDRGRFGDVVTRSATLTATASTVPLRNTEGLLQLPAIRDSRELSAHVKAAGWYRVFTSAISDAGGSNILLSISRSFNLSNCETYQFAISVQTYISSYTPCITQLSGTINSHFIPKIRVVQKFNSIFYIDIYCVNGINDVVFVSGFGAGTFTAPTAGATIPSDYTAIEYNTVAGFKTNYAINSGVQNGVAPFTVASSTMVTNLNAELLGGMTNNQVRSSVMRFFGWMQPTSTTNADLNLLTHGMAHNYHAPSKWTNAPSGMGYGAAITFSQYNYDNLYGQLAWDVNHYTADVTGNLFWRAFATASDGTNKWGGWRQIAFVDGTIANATNADKLDGLHATDFTRKSSLTISAGGVARVTLPESGCLISIRGLNGGRGALVWVTGYLSGTSVRITARIIYSSSNYAFYFNGTSESSGCVYVKSLWTSGTDSITVTALQGSHPALTSVGAVPSDATLIGSSATLAALTDNVASATNADKLDNKHGLEYQRDLYTYHNTQGFADATVDPNILSYATGLSGFRYFDTKFYNIVSPSANRFQIAYPYADAGTISYRTYYNSAWSAWQHLARTTDNVASASKLQTARSIWGQNFDGTSAITGNMIHVGEFRFEAGTAVLHNATTKVYQLWAVNGINLFPTWSVNTAVLSVTPNGNVGRVGVNMFSPAYDFDVTGVIHASGEIFSDKAIGGKGTPSSSDIRLKHIVGNVELSFEAILNSPSKRFTWLGDPTETERIGTTAQYWLTILPQVVYTAPDGYYAVDYGTLANAKADTIAHVVAKLVERLNKLESQLNSIA